VARYYSDEIISQLLERADIVEIISDTVSLKKAGANQYKGLCPFHSETDPSFTVHQDRQFFYCFGCSTGGNALHFLIKTRGLTFPEAVEELAARYQFVLPQDSSPSKGGRTSEKKSLLQINSIATDFFHGLLLSEQGNGALAYLEQRGIDSKDIEAHKLGYAPTGWNKLVSYLEKKGTSLGHSEKVGLIIRKKGGGYYDRFRERIIFPIINERNETIGFGGRALNETQPKYINSPDSVIYKKSEVLYGLSKARPAIRDNDRVLIVEGYFDLITLNKFGIFNVLATCGTALTTGHLRRIKRWTRNVVTLFDADESGAKATNRSLELMLDEGLSARVISLPVGDDPDSFLRRERGEAFQAKMKEAIPLMTFFMDHVIKGQDLSMPEDRIRALETIIPMIGRIRQPIEKDYFIERLSDRLNVREPRIRDMLQRGVNREEFEDRSFRIELDPLGAEKLILQLMLQRNETIPKITDGGIIGEFQSSSLHELANKIVEMYEREGSVDAKRLSLFVNGDDKAINRISEFTLREERITNPQKILTDCIGQIRRNRIRKEIKRLNEDVHKAMDLQDEGLMNSLIVKRQALLDEQKRLRVLQ
jgi:DNA primase